MECKTQGQKLQALLKNATKPLIILGAPTPFTALQMEEVGFEAAYLSGAGMSYFTYGIPDVGILGLQDVVFQTKKFSPITTLPLLVDADTGFDDPEQTTAALIEAGAAGCHIEDQTEDKRCGHLDGKTIVSTDEMCERIKAAKKGCVDDPHFMLMARTDALATEGIDVAIERLLAYVEAGANAVFAEAMEEIEQYQKIKKALGIDIPLLANMTEYGKTPLFTQKQLAEVDVDMMLMPVSLNRAMHAAVWPWLDEIKKSGTTQSLVEHGEIRPRHEYSDLIDYDPKTDTRATVLKRLMERNEK